MINTTSQSTYQSIIQQPIDHLDILMRMAEASIEIRRAASERYIEQREILGRSEQYAAISALKVISNTVNAIGC